MCFFLGGGDSIIFYRAILIFLRSLDSKMSLNTIFFCSECWTRVLIDVCDVSRIIYNENPCKMFSNNS